MSAGVAVAFKIEFGGHKTQTAFNTSNNTNCTTNSK